MKPHFILKEPQKQDSAITSSSFLHLLPFKILGPLGHPFAFEPPIDVEFCFFGPLATEESQDVRPIGLVDLVLVEDVEFSKLIGDEEPEPNVELTLLAPWTVPTRTLGICPVEAAI